jgi:branched-subunit amino acid aminotransferase/4-amino-4-deoxychorismate lyase
MLKMDDIYAASEVFLTGTAAEIIPVVAVDERLGTDRLLGVDEVGDDGAQHLETTIVGASHSAHLLQTLPSLRV